ncbi:MAG: cation:proton antiporter [Cyanobacteriota bacterium]
MTFLTASITAAASSPEINAYLPGTLLPRGFFLILGVLYLGALAVDRLSERLRMPASLGVLLLGFSLHAVHPDFHRVTHQQVESLHLFSLALLLFYAGLKTDLNRIRGTLGFGLKLASLGSVVTVVLFSGTLIWWGRPLTGAGADLLLSPIPWSAALVTASCLVAIDASATDDLLESLDHSFPARLRHLLHFESSLTTLAALICFGFLVSMLEVNGHAGHADFHPARIGPQGVPLLDVLRHLISGILAGLLVGIGARPLINRLVRAQEHLLIMTISLAFITYGLGQFFGGGGMVAVFISGLLLGNWHYRSSRFDQKAMREVMLPFNTGAEFTILLLLGILVSPADVLTMLPLGICLALVLLLVIRPVSLWISSRGSKVEPAELLLLSFGGVRAGVSLALAMGLHQELSHLRGVMTPQAEDLAANLTATVFVVVLVATLLQALLLPLLVRRLEN